MDSKIKKYEKKIEKAKISLNRGDLKDIKKLTKTIEKYEIKIRNRSVIEDDHKEEEHKTVGVTILLFYAYVEPPWAPNQVSASNIFLSENVKHNR